MGVDGAAAESGKMLATGEYVFFLHAGEKAAGVVNDPPRRGGDHAGAENGGGLGEREVEDGSEDGVEAESAGFAGDEQAMLAEKVAPAGGKDSGSGGHGSDDVAKAIDEAAFEVDAAEERGGADAVGLAQQGCYLRGLLDIAAEENDAAEADVVEPGALFSGERGPFDASDEDLAGLLGELHIAAAGHEDARLATAIGAGFGGGSGFLSAPSAHGLVAINSCWLSYPRFRLSVLPGGSAPEEA